MQVKPKEKRLDSTVKKHKKPLKSNDEIVKMCIRMQDETGIKTDKRPQEQLNVYEQNKQSV